MKRKVYKVHPRRMEVPKFVLDEHADAVSLIDEVGNVAKMSIEHFNKFVRAVKTGEIKEITLLRKR